MRIKNKSLEEKRTELIAYLELVYDKHGWAELSDKDCKIILDLCAEKKSIGGKGNE